MHLNPTGKYMRSPGVSPPPPSAHGSPQAKQPQSPFVLKRKVEVVERSEGGETWWSGSHHASRRSVLSQALLRAPGPPCRGGPVLVPLFKQTQAPRVNIWRSALERSKALVENEWGGPT